MIDVDRGSDTRPIAVVTGATRGLGHTIARRLVDDGFDVLAIARTMPDAPERGGTDEAGAGDAAGTLAFATADVAEDSAGHRIVAAACERFGRIDCLVNAAGVLARPPVDLLAVDAEELDRSFAVNARGPVLVGQAVARHWEGEGAHVGVTRTMVNIGSIAAELIETSLPQYCISKAALAACTQLFAARLAPQGIGVFEVRPGFIAREGGAGLAAHARAEWARAGGVPMRRQGAPNDVATIVSAIARGALPYVTGQIIWAAGGLNIATTGGAPVKEGK